MPYHPVPRSLVLHRLFLMIGLGILLAACQERSPDLPLSPNLEARLVAYSHGSISRTAPIRIQFQEPVVGKDQAGQEADPRLLSFQPGLAGSLVWEDEQTLRFQPADPLPSGQTFTAFADLESLFSDLDGKEARFSFSLFTFDQFLTLRLDGLQAASPEQPERQLLRGTALSADYLHDDDLASGFSAWQEGRALDITWQHAADGRSHRFEVRGIRRLDRPSAVVLQWDGDRLSLAENGSRRIAIPPRGIFQVTGVDVAYQPEPYLIVHFSDPLAAGQNLAGLVDIPKSPTRPRLDIDGQQLRVYPTNALSGEITLRLEGALASAQGLRLNDTWVSSETIEGIKPAVRIVGEGVILPDTEGLLFPFEAIGLRAVDLEVFKIYNNNILQFFQSQSLGEGGSGLREVGKVVHRQRLDLGNLPDSRSWIRHAVDLSPWLGEDRAAIYQVRIGFRPEYADYPCPSEGQATAPLPADIPDNLMEWWYGPYGYYPGYRYEQREDPCFPAYYNSNRFLRRHVLSSNLGLLVKGADTGPYLTVVSDLRTAEPLVGAKVTYYDYQQQAIASGQTDSRGTLKLDLDRDPFVVVAQQGRDRGYLRLNDGDALSTSAFPVEGAEVQEGLKGFLYAERGVWRPGDSIFLHLIVEHAADRLPAGFPMKVSLFDPRGRRQEERVVSTGNQVIQPIPFRTDREAPTGNWLARVELGGATFEKVLPVETVQPNRLDLELDLPGPVLAADEQPFRGDLSVRWLQGAPGANLKADVEVTLHPDPSPWPEHRPFTFRDPTREVPVQPREVFSGTTDRNGNATFRFELMPERALPGPLRADFRLRAFEPGGAFSRETQTAPFHPYATYVGVSLPEDEFGLPAFPLERSSDLRIKAIDREGRARPGVDLQATLYRLDWRWWWESGRNNVSRFNAADLMQRVGEPTALRTGPDGQAAWSVQPPRWGRYLLRVCDPAGGHCAATIAYAGTPGPEAGSSQREAAAMLPLRTDKETYRPGETVRLTIPQSKAGRMLLTLENGTRIIERYWAEADSLETSFSFPVTADMAPNVYAHVTILQPHGQTENDLPMRLYGIQNINVEDPATRLQPALEAPASLTPEQAFEVEVREATGRPMAYTLAIVEEGLLALTRFQTPDPHAAMYAREALGIRTWDLFDQVLGPFGGTPHRLLATGGDGGVEWQPEAESANRFDPVVMQAGPFYLEAGARATHAFRMPNYVGRVRLMLVAANRDGAYGSTDGQATVRQDLMVLPTLPRTLRPGESCLLPVNVFAMAPSLRSATLTVTGSPDLIAWPEGTQQTVTFAKEANPVVYFPFRVLPKEGLATFEVRASGANARSRQEVNVQISNPNPPLTRTYQAVLEPSETWRPAFSLPGAPDNQSLRLEVSQMPPLDLGRRLDYLVEYPYGCLEQTVSGAFAQLFLPRLMELAPDRLEQVRANIRAAIVALAGYQLPSGGFGYWPGQSRANAWVSSYAGQFLLEAKAQGYALPPGLMEQWLAFQQGLARAWSPRPQLDDRRTRELTQAYRLYTMALAQYPDLAAMNILREQPTLTPAARWQLAAAYGQAGRTEVARDLIRNQSGTFEPYGRPGTTFGSALRDRAMIMETLLLLGRQTEAADVLRDLSNALSADRWLSTQTTAFALWAAYRFAGDAPPAGTLAFTLTPVEGQTLRGRSEAPAMEIDLPVGKAGQAGWELRNAGEGKLFARLIATGKPTGTDVPARTENLRLEIRYLGLDGEPLDPRRLLQGTDFLAEARVRHTGTLPFAYENLALEQIFPSGWEIMPEGDPGATGESPSAYTYRDTRDDRVHTFFDLGPREERIFRVRLNAAYLGRFYLPPSSCQAMYDERISGNTASGWVQVVRPDL